MSHNRQARPAAAHIVGEYLLYTAHLPREEVARLAGVCVFTIDRWSRRPPRQLAAPLRERLLRYLRSRAGAPAHRHGGTAEVP